MIRFYAGRHFDNDLILLFLHSVVYSRLYMKNPERI